MHRKNVSDPHLRVECNEKGDTYRPKLLREAELALKFLGRPL